MRLQSVLFLTFLSLASFGQAKKDLAISFSTGILNSPYYQKSHARGFYNLSFDYHISERHILSASYLAGKHDYYENTNTTALVSYKDGTNATTIYNTFSVLYKYKIINHKKLSITPAIGAGILTHTQEYPYKEGPAIYITTSSWSDLVFPVSLDLTYKASKHWLVGITGGFLIHPDFPVLAFNAGPKLSYVIK